MQQATHIPHTPGYYDLLEKTPEEGSWTSPRHSSRRAAQRGRRSRGLQAHPPPLMSGPDSSDGHSGLDGEGKMLQCNLTGADLDDEGEDPGEGGGPKPGGGRPREL